MGTGAAGWDPRSIVARVPAAHREANGTVYVATVGWSGDVYELSGAAAAVWSEAEVPISVAEIAHRCNVATDDSWLAMALSSLVNQGLLEVEATGP